MIYNAVLTICKFEGFIGRYIYSVLRTRSQFSLSLPYAIACKVQSMCRLARCNDILRLSRIHHVFHQLFDVESSYHVPC